MPELTDTPEAEELVGLQAKPANDRTRKTLVSTAGKTRRPKGFFQEEGGKYSAMRLMSFVSLLAAIMFGLIVVTHGATGDGMGITFGFLVGAFAPKSVQKFAETTRGSED